MGRCRGGRGVVLTGGIGSGKSSVGRLLAGWGAFVIDADQLAREVVAPGSQGLAAVVALLGRGVLTSGGSLDRSAMAELIFADETLLAEVESIIHPLVHQASIQALALAPPDALRVYEVPLPGRSPFTESPFVVVVDAPDEVRRERLLTRGVSEGQVSARMRQQPTREEWLTLADWVVDNSGSTDNLNANVRELWLDATGEDIPVGADG